MNRRQSGWPVRSAFMKSHRHLALGTLLVLGLALLFLTQVEAADPDLAALSKEYFALKARQRQLKQGEFDHQLSGSGGRYAEVIWQLSKRLGQPNTAKSEVLRYMGKPDAILASGKYQPGSPGNPGGQIPKGEAHLVYFWRGWHDYVYFVCRGSVVLKVGHYAALE